MMKFKKLLRVLAVFGITFAGGVASASPKVTVVFTEAFSPSSVPTSANSGPHYTKALVSAMVDLTSIPYQDDPRSASEWIWKWDVVDLPANTEVSIIPKANDPSKAMVKVLFRDSGHYTITVQASVQIPTKNDLVLFGEGKGKKGAAGVKVKAVQISYDGKAFFDLGAGPYNMPKGAKFVFQAVPSPDNAEWPKGYPKWSGLGTGSKPQTTVDFKTVSAKSDDAKQLTASCDNEVSAGFVIFDFECTPTNSVLSDVKQRANTWGVCVRRCPFDSKLFRKESQKNKLGVSYSRKSKGTERYLITSTIAPIPRIRWKLQSHSNQLPLPVKLMRRERSILVWSLQAQFGWK